MSNLEKFQFTWKVENFSMFPYQKGKYLKSANFTTHIFDGVDFHLRLYPRGEENNVKMEEDYMSCYLNSSKTGASPIQVGFSLTLQAVEHREDIVLTSESNEFVSGSNWGYEEFADLDFAVKCLFIPNDVLTIQCVIWSPGNQAIVSNLRNWNVEPSRQFSSKTGIHVDKRCVTWPIANIQELKASKGRAYCHIEKALENTPSFEMSFFFTEDDLNCEHAQIDITPSSSRTNVSISIVKSIFVKCQITVMSACEEKYQHSIEGTHLFTLDTPETWHFPNFMATSELEVGNYTHMDNTLYLLCEFSFSSENFEVSHFELPVYSQSIFRLPQAVQPSHLSRNIQKYYKDGTFCDVTIKVEDRTFLAQKLVLCAQSPVFRAMFTNDMEEKKTNIVEVVDIDAQTMEIMLEFLHCDAIEDKDSALFIFQNVSSLYSAADKYKISHLKQFSIRRLLSTLSVDNIVDVLIFADHYQEHFLMSYAQYFLKNCGVGIFQSENWGCFLSQNPSLCGRIMIQVMKNM